MLILSILSYSAGYVLNEELSINRLCKKLNYPHPGWLILYREGFLLFLFYIFTSFYKSWVWGYLLKNTLSLWYVPAVLYILGNISALGKVKGFSLWSTFAGIIAAGKGYLLLQTSFTVAIVCLLLSNDKSLTLKAWKSALIFFFSLEMLKPVLSMLFQLL